MIDSKSDDFRNLIHNWCETQRIAENEALQRAFDTPETRATRNFFRNPIINSQIDDVTEIISNIDINTKQSYLDFNIIESDRESLAKQNNDIVHALVQNLNNKLRNLHQKLEKYEV